MKYLSLVIKCLSLIDSIRTALADGRLTEEEVHDFLDKGSKILLSTAVETA